MHAIVEKILYTKNRTKRVKVTSHTFVTQFSIVFLYMAMVTTNSVIVLFT